MGNLRAPKLLVLPLLLALLASAIPAPANAGPSTVKLIFHYQRSGDDYTGWNLWLWKNVTAPSGDKAISENGVAFNGEDAFGKVLTIDIADMSAFENLGFIVRLNAWAAKDIDADRLITNFDANGRAEVWIMQGDPKVYTSVPSTEAKLRTAKIDEFNSITVATSRKIPLVGKGAEGFQVNNGLTVTSVQALNGTASSASLLSLKLSGAIDLGNKYTITHATLGVVDAIAGNIMNSNEFNARFHYLGNDLGNTYTPAKTAFRVWAPTATGVTLVVHASDSTVASAGVETEMKPDVNGTWVATLTGNQNGVIYTYSVKFGLSANEAVDPYVRATTVNGDRGVVVDLSKTNPSGWNNIKPKFSGNSTDAVIYELHIRDLSIDKSSGIPAAHQGKYLALTDTKTKNTLGGKSGVSAIKDLGVTHVELLPIFDFASVDENNPTFNWGYDPKNYNVPEGSYSTNPKNPTSRITELKRAIQSLHNQGLRVNMDVVYNHVYDVSTFSQEQIVPGYFFRKNPDGTLANGSGVGNEVASERPMVRKFIVDSVKFWASEYHMDGFRFDLMGLIDLTTMKQVRKELTAIDPTIMVLGEGWNMGDVLPSEVRSTQVNIAQLPGISVFNDQIRDGIKGSVFESGDLGFATGFIYGSIDVRAGIVGNIKYGNFVTTKWTSSDPSQAVNYVESHDNLTLYDKLSASVIGASNSKLKSLARYSSSIALLAQGSPFIQAGQEFMRSKDGDSNSYKSSDAVNSLKWDERNKNVESVEFFKGLIAIRAAHPAFRMKTTAQIKANLKFVKVSKNLIAYSINGKAVKDSWNSIVVIHNSGLKSEKVMLPTKGKWNIVIQGSVASLKPINSFVGNSVAAPAQSTLVLTK